MAACVLTAAGLTLTAACSAFGGGGPRVSNAVPGRVPAGSSTLLLIQGDNFSRDAAARLGANDLAGVTWVNTHTLTAVLPAGLPAGSYDLTVSNAGSGSATLRNAVQVQGSAAAPAAAPTSNAPPPTATRSTDVTRTAPPTPTDTPSPSPTATATQATRTAPTATQPPTRLPAATRPPQTQQPSATASVAGTWHVVDSVQYGAGAGQQFAFTLTLNQQGNQVSGGGDGIVLQGSISGRNITAGYRQDNGSTGTFYWTLDDTGTSLEGTFDNSIGNGGASIGQRVTGATVAYDAGWPASEHRSGPKPKKGH